MYSYVNTGTVDISIWENRSDKNSQLDFDI